MQQCLPMLTGSKFKMETSSPIQVWSPMDNFQGKWIFTRGLMTTPHPTCAPKQRRTKRLIAEGKGNGVKNKPHFKRYHAASHNFERPRSRPNLASNRSFLTFVINTGEFEDFFILNFVFFRTNGINSSKRPSQRLTSTLNQSHKYTKTDRRQTHCGSLGLELLCERIHHLGCLSVLKIQ